MKIKIALAIMLASMLSAFGQQSTWFYYQGYNSDGSPQTNPITFKSFPPVNQITIVGTNIFSGGVNPTFQPTAAGLLVTNIAPGGYSVQIPYSNSGGSGYFTAYANIPYITTITNSLSQYLTNQPVVSGSITSYQIITNGLGYAPGTNGVPLLTASNPTNSFTVNTIYTAPAYKSLLVGFTLGGILYVTNNSIAYQIPCTNGFSYPLTTNATFSFQGQNLTNCVDWGNL